MDTQPLSQPPFKRSLLSLILGFVLLLLMIVGGSIYLQSAHLPLRQKACTTEARLCPGGTTVGRTGPNCEFAPCPTVAPPATATELIPTVDPTPTPVLTANCCTTSQLHQGYQCVKNCGSPVQRAGDKSPGYSCLPKKEAEDRKYFGCPICLSSQTMIAVPGGQKNVMELETGDYIYSLDKNGKKITVPIIQTFFAKVPSSHTVFHLMLSDGRQAFLSPFHPLAGKKIINDLKVGSYYDNAVVKKIDLLPYDGDRTYDILPKSDTGYYWADGILVGSTLKEQNVVKK